MLHTQKYMYTVRFVYETIVGTNKIWSLYTGGLYMQVQ